MQSQSIIGYSKNRIENDFYPTPTSAVLEIIKRESFEGSIYEPACGDGAISKVLQEKLPNQIISSDLIDRGFGVPNIDFLQLNKNGLFKTPEDIQFTQNINNIITNPPYKIAKEFINKSLEIADKKVIMLLKLAFLESVDRYDFFKKTPLRTVYVFSRRLTFNPVEGVTNKGGMLCFAWFVWEQGYTGKPYIDWIM